MTSDQHDRVRAVRDPMGFTGLVPDTIQAGGMIPHKRLAGNDIPCLYGRPGRHLAVKGAISDEQQPSVESLGSESVMINNYSAKFGESDGGVFNYTSKSGTNRVHGTAFGYIENEDLDAGQPFNDTSSGQKYNPVQRELGFGGSFGGPRGFLMSTTATTKPSSSSRTRSTTTRKPSTREPLRFPRQPIAMAI